MLWLGMGGRGWGVRERREIGMGRMRSGVGVLEREMEKKGVGRMKGRMSWLGEVGRRLRRNRGMGGWKLEGWRGRMRGGGM